jgi:hypothetical protein
MTVSRQRRNAPVARAVDQALARIDAFIGGESIVLPAGEYRRAVDTLLTEQKASIRTAALFLTFYRLQDPAWDLHSVPVGSRGRYDDKRLSEELSRRSITLHGNIKAWEENLGSKGNVRRFRFDTDPRLSDFIRAIAAADQEEQRRIADYLAQRFAESQRIATPLPPVLDTLLTFVRAKAPFYTLLGIRSEGHIQQFLIASLLHELRRKQSIEVTTHHPHASDRFDRTAGDIEEFQEGRLVRAYEVTVRDDWQTRISGFKEKMDLFGLTKYVIIAANVNAAAEWAEPTRTALALEPYGRDIAVIDIRDCLNFFAMELSPSELREAINRVYGYLSNPRLCDRQDFKDAYREAVNEWLDHSPSEEAPQRQ